MDVMFSSNKMSYLLAKEDVRKSLLNQSIVTKGEMKTYYLGFDTVLLRTSKFIVVDLDAIEIHAESRAEVVILVCDYMLKHWKINVYDDIYMYCAVNFGEATEEETMEILTEFIFMDYNYDFWIEEKKIGRIVLKN